MTHNKLISELKKRRGERTWKQVAAEIGCSGAYLSDVLRGHRRPGKKILEYLGFKAETVYVSNGAKVPGKGSFRGKTDTEQPQ